MQVLDEKVMKSLREPYRATVTEPNQERLFTKAVGIEIPSVFALAAAIDADMDLVANGIGWWVGHPVGDRRRILISDHLLECVRSIEKNLVDAQMHRLALQHCQSLEDKLFVNAGHIRRDRWGNQQAEVALPVRASPVEDLPRVLSDLHRVGFFRAVGSALDCLAGATIGVMAVPLDLFLKSGLNSVRNWLTKQALKRQMNPNIQAGFGVFLERTIAGVGPTESIDWVLGMRNMYVHRARRMEYGDIQIRDSGVLTTDERSSHAMGTMVHRLPRSPQQSDIEVFSDPTSEWVLHEDANTTIAGVLASTVALVEATCAGLLGGWKLRRSAPHFLPQPREQWNQGTPSKFTGYAPRPSVPPTSMRMNPQNVRRLRVASLDGARAAKWKTIT